ncbi:MAG: hypothetical protein IJL76_02915 [Bacilli bacterium]|nr:hypothetical protein [Bacilli bacterium]
MANIIRTLEDKKIINQANPIENSALEVLLDFDMPGNIVSVVNNLYYDSNTDTQVLLEVKNKSIREIDIIDGTDKYMIINDSENELLGIYHETNDSKPIFTTHFYSLKNGVETEYYDYYDIINRRDNIFEFEKEKDIVKTLVK